MPPLNVKNAALGLLALSAAVSTVELAGRSLNHYLHPSPAPLHSLAAQFIGLQKVFAGVSRAGYYTDKNLDFPIAIAQFEQAQYVLAPTVLELNNTSLPLVIFDCTTPAIALAKIKELNLTPVSASNTGIILAMSPSLTLPTRGEGTP